MGFFSGLANVLMEANEGAHGIRLLRDAEKTAERVREMRQDILAQAGELIGPFLFDELSEEFKRVDSYAIQDYLRKLNEELPTDMRELPTLRAQCIEEGRNSQKLANTDQRLSTAGSLAMWVIGLYLESSVRDGVEAIKAHFIVRAIIGRMLLELADQPFFKEQDM